MWLVIFLTTAAAIQLERDTGTHSTAKTTPPLDDYEGTGAIGEGAPAERLAHGAGAQTAHEETMAPHARLSSGPAATESSTAADLTPGPTPARLIVSAGLYPGEIKWTLSCDDGTSVEGGTPYDELIPSVNLDAVRCQLELRDGWGDGWNGAYWVGLGQNFTLLSGSVATESFGGPPTSSPTPVPTTLGTQHVTVSAGSYPGEITWTLSCDDGTSVGGGAPYDQLITSVSLGAVCQLELYDSWGDGWNGAYWAGFGQNFTLFSGSSARESVTTPIVARNSISATGDPHMTSVTGAKFDIMRSGNHTLLHVPQHSLQESALVFVRAFVKHEGATCLDMYIKSLHITGKWAEERQRGGFNFFANRSGRVSEGWLSFGKLDLKIVYGTTVSGVRYLNMFARHLAKLSMPIGGILGLDDHKSAATPEANCHRSLALLSVLPGDISSSSLVEESGGQESWAVL